MELLSESIKNSIKNTVLGYLPESSVLVFGSRATGSATEGSDLDLLILTHGELDKSNKLYWLRTIRKELIYKLNLPVDLFIYSKMETGTNLLKSNYFLCEITSKGVLL